MKKIQGIYIALCAALFFAVPADAAYSVTAYGLRPEEIQAIIISAVDPSGRGNLAKCSPLNMVLTYHIAPERVQSMMPECVVKGENGAPDKKESLPVFTALYAQIFTSRLTSDGGIRVSMRGEYIANPGSFFASYTFPDKHADYFEVSRYLQAYFTGGTGSGMRLSFTMAGYMFPLFLKAVPPGMPVYVPVTGCFRLTVLRLISFSAVLWPVNTHGQQSMVNLLPQIFRVQRENITWHLKADIYLLRSGKFSPFFRILSLT